MFMDILAIMRKNMRLKQSSGKFSSLQESFKPLQSYFCVLLGSLEHNMISGTNYINEMLLQFPNRY